ncbi:MAG: hypothetical protein V3W11_06315 [bacterium]
MKGKIKLLGKAVNQAARALKPSERDEGFLSKLLKFIKGERLQFARGAPTTDTIAMVPQAATMAKLSAEGEKSVATEGFSPNYFDGVTSLGRVKRLLAEEEAVEVEEEIPLLVLIRPGETHEGAEKDEAAVTTAVRDAMAAALDGRSEIEKITEGFNWVIKPIKTSFKRGVEYSTFGTRYGPALELAVKKFEENKLLRVALIDIHCNADGPSNRGTLTFYGHGGTNAADGPSLAEDLAQKIHYAVYNTMYGFDDSWEHAGHAEAKHGIAGPSSTFAQLRYGDEVPDPYKDEPLDYGMKRVDYDMRYYAVLTELGFLTNDDDERWLIKPFVQKALGRAMANAVVEWHGSLKPLQFATQKTAKSK